MRSLLSVAGMIGAVVAVVVVSALGEVSSSATTQFLAEQYGRPATIGVSATVENSTAGLLTADHNYESEANLSWQLRDMLLANGVTHVSVSGSTQVYILQGDRFVQTSGLVVSPEYQDIKIIDISAGSFPEITSAGSVPHVLISDDFARSLGWTPQVAVGQPLVVSTTPLHSYSDPELLSSSTITVIVDGVAQWHDGGDPVSMLFVTSSPDATLWGSNSVSLQARIAPGDLADVEELVNAWVDAQTTEFIETQVSRLDKVGEFAPVLAQLRSTGTIVSLVALAIGGLGILGAGLAGVRERSQEFGLRRALGASTPRVFLSVLCQTTIEAGLVILMALPIAFLLLQVLVSQVMPADLPDPGIVMLPLSSTWVGIVATIAVSLFASLMPAVRAARASVVQALRT